MGTKISLCPESKEIFHSHINTQTIFKFPDRLIGRRACLRLILQRHVDAPGSINSKRITSKPSRQGIVSMCACTEPVRTGIGAVCVEYGRPKWPITMLNHTHQHQHTHKHPRHRIMFCFLFLAPSARTTRYEEACFSLENQGKKGSLRSRAS